MKFFSNEKEDETQQDADRTASAAARPATVPPQRAGSPWSEAPRDAGDSSPVSYRDDINPDDSYSAASHTADSPTPDSHTADSHTPDSPTADSPTADSHTADSPIADSGTAASHTADDSVNIDDSRTADAELADRAPRDGTEETVSTTTYGPEGSVVEDTTYQTEFGDRPRDDSDLGDSDHAAPVGPDEGDAKSPSDETIKDEGTLDSPKAVEPATGEPVNDSLPGDGDTDGRRDGEKFQPASDTTASDAPAPVVAAAAVPAAATSGSTGDTAKLLPDGQSFAERFRDIQLRFVDEPKDATAEAATLVGEAVDKLTSALKAQRDGLAGNSDDTEKLRVELRAYRDILNRLLAL